MFSIVNYSGGKQKVLCLNNGSIKSFVSNIIIMYYAHGLGGGKGHMKMLVL